MAKRTVLWVNHFVPYPPKGGNFQRSYNLIKGISRYFDVHLVAIKHKASTHPQEEARRAQEELGRFCKHVEIVDISDSTSGVKGIITAMVSLLTPFSFTLFLYNNAKLKKLLKEINTAERFDIVHLDSICLANYMSMFDGVAKVLNHHGAEAYMMRRRITHENNFLKKIYFYIESIKLRREERRYIKLADANLVVSELDARLLGDDLPETKFSVIENGVDVSYYDINREAIDQNKVVFAASLDNYSNKDAILWFCRDVWPILKRHRPALSLDVIGNYPPPQLYEMAAGDSSINILGYVDDLRPYFERAALSVIPIRSGGGTRLKVLDSFSMRIPVIATSTGVEGLDVVPDVEFLCANNAEEFLEQVDKIVEKRIDVDELTKNARKKAVEKYSWDVVVDKLNGVYTSLLQC